MFVILILTKIWNMKSLSFKRQGKGCRETGNKTIYNLELRGYNIQPLTG